MAYVITKLYRRVIRLAETDEEVKEECIMIGVNTTVCQEVEDHEAENIIIHGGYTGKVGSLNDIALIRLKESVRNISSRMSNFHHVNVCFLHGNYQQS